MYTASDLKLNNKGTDIIGFYLNFVNLTIFGSRRYGCLVSGLAHSYINRYLCKNLHITLHTGVLSHKDKRCYDVRLVNEQTSGMEAAIIVSLESKGNTRLKLAAI